MHAADELNMTVFSGTVLPFDYMATPEGREVTAAFAKYSARALAAPGAPNVTENPYELPPYGKGLWFSQVGILFLLFACASISRNGHAPVVKSNRRTSTNANHIIAAACGIPR